MGSALFCVAIVAEVGCAPAEPGRNAAGGGVGGGGSGGGGGGGSGVGKGESRGEPAAKFAFELDEFGSVFWALREALAAAGTAYLRGTSHGHIARHASHVARHASRTKSAGLNSLSSSMFCSQRRMPPK